MRNKFDVELEDLNLDLIRMGARAEETITKVVSVIENCDMEGAKEIIEDDDLVDAMARQIESRSMKLIMKQQPVASDLRVISATLKMVTDLHRIGDQSLDIAEIVLTGQLTQAIRTQDFRKMGEAVVYMVKSSVEAFQARSLEHAKEVIAYDDVVDEYFEKIKFNLLERIRGRIDDSDRDVLDMLMIAKYLERIGDHAANVGNWVAFSVNGELLPDN